MQFFQNIHLRLQGVQFRYNPALFGKRGNSARKASNYFGVDTFAGCTSNLAAKILLDISGRLNCPVNETG